MNENTPLIARGSGTRRGVDEQTAIVDLVSLSHRETEPYDPQRNLSGNSRRYIGPNNKHHNVSGDFHRDTGPYDAHHNVSGDSHRDTGPNNTHHDVSGDSHRDTGPNNTHHDVSGDSHGDIGPYDAHHNVSGDSHRDTGPYDAHHNVSGDSHGDTGPYDAHHDVSGDSHRDTGPYDARQDFSWDAYRDTGPCHAQSDFSMDYVRQAAPTCVCDESERGEERYGERDIVSDTGNQSSFFKMSTRQRWVLLLLAMSNFGIGSSVAVQAPFFPAEAKRQGMPLYLVGFVFGCFELCIVVASPIFGSFVHRLGVRRLYIGGQLTAGTCTILFGTLYLSPPGAPFTALCFLLRTLEGLGAAATAMSSLTIVAFEFPAAVATVYGFVEIFYGMGMMLSPVVGGAFFAGFVEIFYGMGMMLSPVVGGAFFAVGGYLLPFVVIGALLIVSAMSAIVFLPAISDITQREGKGPSMLQLLKSPIIVVCSVNIVTAELAYNMLPPVLALHLEQFNMSAVCVGLFFMAPLGCYACSAPLIGWLCDKKNLIFSLLIGGDTVLLVYFLLIGPAPFLPFLETNLASLVVGLMMTGPAFASTICPAIKCYYLGARRLGFKDGLVLDGLVSGLVTASIHLGIFAGYSLGSLVQEASSFQWMCTCGAALSLFSLLCLTGYLIAEKTCLKYDKLVNNDDDTYKSER